VQDSIFMANELNKMIDHTLLKPDAVASDYAKLCKEAKTYNFATVCVPPTWIKFCKDELAGSTTKVISVVGFPLGYSLTETKAIEAAHCVALGAEEIDMVINISRVKSGDSDFVVQDIASVVRASFDKPVKVILEISELNEDQIVLACIAAKKAGARFVKTSTGFSKSGATEAAVKLMRKTVGADFGVKASGGISSTEQARLMLLAGANRLGCSKSVEIVLGKNASSIGSY
jgi:deoxyribose-phosphate aldolase